MELAFKKYGTPGQHPLVILHGFLGSGDNWATLARAWSETKEIWVPDLRNHGRSPHSELMTYESMAEDIWNWMQHQKIIQPILLGHSMGAKVGMTLSRLHGTEIHGLIALDMPPGKSPELQKPYLDALLRLPLDQLTSRKDVDDFLAREIPNHQIRLFLLKNLDRQEDGSFRWKCNLPVLARAYSQITEPIGGGKNYAGKTIFIKGGASPYIQDKDQPLIQELFPKAQCITIPHAGHWVHVDAPQELSEIVLAFCEN